MHEASFLLWQLNHTRVILSVSRAFIWGYFLLYYATWPQRFLFKRVFQSNRILLLVSPFLWFLWQKSTLIAFSLSARRMFVGHHERVCSRRTVVTCVKTHSTAGESRHSCWVTRLPCYLTLHLASFCCHFMMLDFCDFRWVTLSVIILWFVNQRLQWNKLSSLQPSTHMKMKWHPQPILLS